MVQLFNVSFREKNFSFNANEVLNLINDKTRLLIVNNPQNPTGGLIEKAKLQLANGLALPNVVIFSDEIILDKFMMVKVCILYYPELYNRLIVMMVGAKHM